MSDKVPTEAAIWLARIERGLQPSEGAQLREWLQRPEHRDAIVSAAKLYHGPDVVAVLAELVPVGFGNPQPPRPRQPRTFAIIVAVCLAVFMVLPILAARRAFPGLFNPHKPAPGTLPRDEAIYTTGVRETRSIKLPEGSEVLLNGQSQLWVLYAAWVREATVGHGEVIFDVTPKWPRPILIFAGGRHFEAAGGRFDLRVLSARRGTTDGAAGSGDRQGPAVSAADDTRRGAGFRPPGIRRCHCGTHAVGTGRPERPQPTHADGGGPA